MNKLKKKRPSSLLVTQSNKLVEARYNLPLVEQRLILLMISKIQPDDEDFKPYCISIYEFADFIGISKSSMYSECKKVTKSLLAKVLEINEKDGLLQTNWVSSAKYLDGKGMVNFSFDPLLKPYLLQLKSGFTTCKLEMLLSFRSQYTMRFYILIKQYEKIGQREFSVDKLRDVIGVGSNLYQQYTDFKKRVILSSQKELKEKSDLYFEFEEIKIGRRIETLRLYIHRNKKFESTSLLNNSTLIEQPITKKSDSEFDSLLSLVMKQHQSKKTVQSGLRQFLIKEGFEYVKRNILYSNTKAAKSYAGFLNKSLKEDWGHDWGIEQQVIKNKNQEIWEKQGFKSEREYAASLYTKHMESLHKN